MQYKIIDNFLSEKLFDSLSSIKLKSINNNEVFNHHNKIAKDGSMLTSCLSEEFLKALHKECHTKAISLLEKFSPQKVSLYEYSDFNIIETGKDYTFPIHRDEVNKLLSGVIYLTPKNNTGTILYDDKKGNNPMQIGWKQNRGFFFHKNREYYMA